MTLWVSSLLGRKKIQASYPQHGKWKSFVNGGYGNINHLVGGAMIILKNMSSSMGRIIPYNYIYVSLYIHIIWKIKHV
jgi:hypothetical protein